MVLENKIFLRFLRITYFFKAMKNICEMFLNSEYHPAVSRRIMRALTTIFLNIFNA